MGTFTRADIVLFPFPFTDLSRRKLRPCLVISEPMGEDIILCQITSQRAPKDEYSVGLKSGQTLEGSLRRDSYIRANMIFTASTSQIHKRICKLTDNDYSAVVETIKRIITR